MREGYPVAVMMIDIDPFKRLNDTFGHLAGDETPRAIRNPLSAGARAEDVEPLRRRGIAVVPPKMLMHTAEERRSVALGLAALPVKFGEFELNATLGIAFRARPQPGSTY